jgi:LPS sulfotransferase NodH
MSKLKELVRSAQFFTRPPAVVSNKTSANMRGYFICATQRSGSNFLCDMIAETGQLGIPREYFNGTARRVIDNDPSYPLDATSQVHRILTTGATPNGIYAAKVFPTHFRQAATAVDIGRSLPHLHFVFLRRRDLLGQAISLVIAKQTGKWRAFMKRARPAVYDPKAISRAIDDLVKDTAAWLAFFARHNVEQVEIVYEDMRTDPPAALNAIARHLGLGPVEPGPSAIDRPVRPAEAREWRQRYVADMGDPLVQRSTFESLFTSFQ